MLSLFSEGYREPAECIIKVGASAQEITDLYPFLTEVRVETSRTEASVATLNFETRRDENGQWSVQDAGILKDWEPIVIEAGFGSATEEVMRGYIRQVKANYPPDGAATLVVECQDSSIALDRLHRRRAWGGDAPTSDTEILSEVLGRYPDLSPYSKNGVTNGTGQTGLVINQDSTDIVFLRERAECNGYELIFSEGMVYFGPWRVDATPQSTIMVYAGASTNCNSFNSTSDGHQPEVVMTEAAENTGQGVVQQSIESNLPLMGTESAASSDAGLDEFAWIMNRSGESDEETLTAAAQNKANELAMKVKAEGELDGTLYGHVLRVGEPVGVDGVGEWLGGIYYVDSVSHVFNFDGYVQNFKLLRNAYGDNLESGVGSVLSGIL